MAPKTILYRAVHTITEWREVHHHTSLSNALDGSENGAPGLFSHRVRTDYTRHGEPLYVVVWVDGARTGYVVKKDSSSSNGTARVEVPIEVLLTYEARKGASPSELERHFLGLAQAESLQPLPALEERSPYPQSEEGAANLQEHFVRERNTALADAKRLEILKTGGRIACEACSFDFGAVYGELGEGFCEVHHLNPVATRGGNQTSSFEDLAILCSNCHSIIHRTSPMWSVTRLAAYLANKKHWTKVG